MCYLSHPDKLLMEHLTEVANVAVDSINRKQLNFVLNFEGKESDVTDLVIDLVYFASAFHDLAKATSFFQYYIQNLNQIHDKRKSHALLSALFVYFVSEKFLKTKNIESNLVKMLSIFTFSAVKRHHGRLINLSDEILIEDEWRELLPELVDSICTDNIQKLINELLIKYNFQIDWIGFVTFIKNGLYNSVFEDFSFEFLQDKYIEEKAETKISLFYIHQFIYSALLFADKNEVILTDKVKPLKQLDIINKISEFRVHNNFNKPKSEIDQLKNEAFYSSAEHLQKLFKKNQHIYSVTLPTGLGKTITAYNLADNMRKLAGFNESKIIINIPFTSIIDQNFDVYLKILKTKDTNALLKHHHLAEPVYKITENTADFYQSKFLIETWQSDTIVTTFVQLLETLWASDKAKLMKFVHLANSIILLDEIQTIPYEYWDTIRTTFKILGKIFNIYFILISATQPLIFNPNEDIVELVPEYNKYFHFFNRTKLIIKGKVSFDEFKAVIIDYIANNSKNDILVIVNTKKIARETFEFVCREIDIENFETYFLTTLITPFERKNIINQIKKKSNRRKIIISTQLVEAGVDISVNTVFRQLSPIDSIIQSAGRANRYYENPEISEVYIYDINDYRKSSNYVYGNDLLIKTENVLKEYRIVEEKDYIQLIEKYFKEVRIQSDNTSQPLLKAIENLNFALVDFKLIESRKTESVYIQLNEKAKELWDNYVSIYSENELKQWEYEEKFSTIKSDFYDFVINVPIPFNSIHIDFDSEKFFNFYVSEYGNHSRNYNYSEEDYSQNTGYVNFENKTFII